MNRIKELEFKQMVAEAKHTFKLLLRFLNDTDTVCNRLLLKWPDVIDAWMEGNYDKVKVDMAVLMCTPLQWIISSITERPTIVTECNGIVKEASKDPIKSKSELMKLYKLALKDAGMTRLEKDDD
jgi:hypothetical protein